jgi:hypothetical protein
MWHHVDLVLTNVSERHVASIFRVEKSASEEPAWAGGCRLSSVCSHRPVHTISTRFHIPKDGILHSHRCENFQSYILLTDLHKFDIPNTERPGETTFMEFNTLCVYIYLWVVHRVTPEAVFFHYMYSKHKPLDVEGLCQFQSNKYSHVEN